MKPHLGFLNSFLAGVTFPSLLTFSLSNYPSGSNVGLQQLHGSIQGYVAFPSWVLHSFSPLCLYSPFIRAADQFITNDQTVCSVHWSCKVHVGAGVGLCKMLEREQGTCGLSLLGLQVLYDAL